MTTNRKRWSVVTSVILVVALAASATAFWTAPGSGTGAATVGTLGSPTPVTVTATTGNAHVAWSAVTSPSGVASDVSYRVTRKLGSGSFVAANNTCAGSLSNTTLACDDNPTVSGSYVYRVTAAFRTWTSSADSSATSVFVTKQLVITSTAQTLTAGVTSGSITVKRQDDGGNAITSGSLTVSLSSNSGAGLFRDDADSTTITEVTIADVSSTATFKYKDTQQGTPTITASATSYTSGTQIETVNPASAASLRLAAASTTPAAGVADNLSVTALDAFGNTDTSYTGDKSLTFSGPANAPSGTHPTVTDKSGAAINFGMPTTITFSSGVSAVSGSSNGVMKLYKAEAASVAVAAFGVTTGTRSVTVGPATAGSLSLAAASTTPTAGVADNLSVTALDAFGNTDTSYAGDKFLTFSGPHTAPDGTHVPTVADKTGAAINFGTPTTITFSSGVSAVSGSSNGVMKLYKAETAFVIVSDGTINNGTGLSVTVSKATTSFTLVAASTTPTAGVADNLTITDKDAYGNIDTSFTGDESLTFGGANIAPDGTTHPTVTNKTGTATNFGTPTTITFASGVSTVPVSTSNNGVMKLYKAEMASVTVSDGAINNGTGLSVTVGSAIAASLSLADAALATPVAGVADNLTITAKDAFGNTATGYTGDKSLTFGGPAVAPDLTHPTVTSTTGAATSFGTPTTITFASGVSMVAVSNNGVMKLYKAETAFVTVSDFTVTPAIGNGTGLSVTVSAAARAGIILTSVTSPATVSCTGAVGSLTCSETDTTSGASITAKFVLSDAYQNVVTNTTGSSIAIDLVVPSSGTGSDGSVTPSSLSIANLSSTTALSFTLSRKSGSGTTVTLTATAHGTSQTLTLTMSR